MVGHLFETDVLTGPEPGNPLGMMPGSEAGGTDSARD